MKVIVKFRVRPAMFKREKQSGRERRARIMARAAKSSEEGIRLMNNGGCADCGKHSWYLWRRGICGTCCNAEDARRFPLNGIDR